MRENGSIFSQLDWITVALVMVLMLLGSMSICGASFSFDDSHLLSLSTRAGKQLLWIACALMLGVIIMFFNQNMFRTYAYVFYVVFMLLLVVTILVATDTKGSRSWIDLGPVKLQPAEFAKFATALALSRYLDDYEFNPNSWKSMFKAISIFLIPMVLIVAQNETGSALVYLAFFFVLFREGMSGFVLLIGFSAILYFVLGLKYWETPFGDMPFTIGPALVLAIIQFMMAVISWLYVDDRRIRWTVLFGGLGTTLAGLIVSMNIVPVKLPIIEIASIVILSVYLLYQAFKNRLMQCLLILVYGLCFTVYLYSCNFVFEKVMQPHQQSRINVILGIEDDPYGAGYNVNQSMIAIGSGGLTGKGFMQGTQTKLKYVPEQDTDFIFCTVGEEQGFFGAAGVLILFALLLLRLYYLAERQSSVFGRAFGYSVASILFLHILINIGMVLGITPVIGIPLPFFSYGGSSLWGFALLIFTFLRFDAERTSRF